MPFDVSPTQNPVTFACPIARIEHERALSPMAQLVRHTNQPPAFDWTSRIVTL